MSDKQIAAVIAIVAIYYWFHAKGMTKYSQQQPISPNRPNAWGNGASQWPVAGRPIPAGVSPTGGNGRGYMTAPVISIGQANAPQLAGPGTSPQSRQVSSSWQGTGTQGTPSWPTNQVTSTGNIPISNGRVQVPGYAAIPATVRGPGGQGSLIYMGGM